MTEKENDFEFPDGDLSEKNSPADLGNRLKAARVAKGFEISEMTEITRLRPRYLEALERGDWESLPSPALTQGFVSTYARALGMDTTGLMQRYRDALPVTESPLFTMVPEVPEKRITPFAGVVCLLVVGLVITGYMLWRTWDAPAPSPLVDPPVAAIEKEQPPPVVAARDVIPGRPDKTVIDEIPEKPVPVIPEPIEITPEPAEEEMAETTEPVPVEPAVESDAPAVGPPEPEPARAPEESEKIVPFTLKASIKERTWIRITVDGGEPREYVFSPGREPEWQAQKSFDLLIGNAGGLDLKLNGEEIGPLGASGQVVRLKLPRTAE